MRWTGIEETGVEEAGFDGGGVVLGNEDGIAPK